jgi:hypothetical protein
VDQTEPTKLVKVSDDTEGTIKNAFGHSLTNGERLQARKDYLFPDLDASRCPKLDPVIKQNLPKEVKDNEANFAKIQTLVLDAVAPLTAILEEATKGSLTAPKAADAAKAALVLLGNASAAISKERRKKIAKELNKDILPLVESDNMFDEAAPMLFGDGFENKVKDHVESLKCLRRAITFSSSSRGRTSNFFRRGRSSYPARGSSSTRGRGGWQRRFQPFPKERTQKKPHQSSQD